MNSGEIEASRSGLFNRRSDDAAVDKTRAGSADDFPDPQGRSARNRVGVDIDAFEVVLRDDLRDFDGGVRRANGQHDVALAQRIG